MEVFRPKSSLLLEMRHDAKSETLEVVFASRTGEPTEFYRYANVDAATWVALKDADSVGRTFFTLIRADSARHPYTKHLINEPVTSGTDTLEDDLKKSVSHTTRKPRVAITKKD